MTPARPPPTIDGCEAKPMEEAVSKVMPIIQAEVRKMPAGAIELRFTGLDGKKNAIAFMPAYIEQLERLLRQANTPTWIASAQLPAGARRLLRDTAEAERRQSPGYSVHADTEANCILLTIRDFDGQVAGIPLPPEQARNLVQTLSRGLSALSDPDPRPQ